MKATPPASIHRTTQSRPWRVRTVGDDIQHDLGDGHRVHATFIHHLDQRGHWVGRWEVVEFLPDHPDAVRLVGHGMAVPHAAGGSTRDAHVFAGKLARRLWDAKHDMVEAVAA